MSWDFSDAPTDQGGVGELIPDGTLAWARLTVRPHNIDQGLFLKTSQAPGKDGKHSQYLDVELTILEGPYAKRKVWNLLGMVGTEAWVNQSRAAIRHILEVGREITNFAAGERKYVLGQQNQQGEAIFEELDGLRCAIKIGVEPGKDGRQDKNTVRAYLSPNPQSNTHKEFLRLVAGDTAPKTTASQAATKPASSAPTWGAPTASQAAPSMPAGSAANPAWGQPQTTSAPATPPAAQGRPGWLGSAPPKEGDSGKPPW